MFLYTFKGFLGLVFKSGSNHCTQQPFISVETQKVYVYAHTDTQSLTHTITAVSISGEVTADLYFLLYVSKVPFSPVSIYYVSKLRTHTILKGKGNLTN